MCVGCYAVVSVKEVRRFLGLVQYISAFLPALAEHTTVSPWMAEHHDAFQAIKGLVVSRDCLTTIDHEHPGNNKIYVTCNASQ